jgi:prepilin-type N-terminal cleavage/methylation domain-containing protein
MKGRDHCGRAPSRVLAEAASHHAAVCDDLHTMHARNEAGFSLPEMIIAMLIVAMLATLGIGGYLRARDTSEATKSREQIQTTYKVIARCKTENDGFYASYVDLRGAYCLSSLTVGNDTELCQLGSGHNGCPSAGSVCWATGATSLSNVAQTLFSSPAHQFTQDGERTYRVGLCTFSQLTGGSSAGSQNAADSSYIRVSARRGNKIYYFVEEPSGFNTYIAQDDDGNGMPDAGTCLRRTTADDPSGGC